MIVANETSELDERARKLRRFSRVTALHGTLKKDEESGRTAPLIAVVKVIRTLEVEPDHELY